MRLLLLATTGGAIGAGARHLVNVACATAWGGRYPWATLIVNVLGSFLMGIVIELAAARLDGGLELRTFLATGILGGFTTFSAYSNDVVTLAARGETIAALLYASGSVALSILALVAGLAAMRWIAS
ncbi:MAG: fluoride efflux transporter CrcB [Hyphomicrobiales bacterium]|nr:fluoride efflux transporter CrcB [Hyphomicrobiales bacterium]